MSDPLEEFEHQLGLRHSTAADCFCGLTFQNRTNAFYDVLGCGKSHLHRRCEKMVISVLDHVRLYNVPALGRRARLLFCQPYATKKMAVEALSVQAIVIPHMFGGARFRFHETNVLPIFFYTERGTDKLLREWRP
jgi:hypothetical protein